MLTGKVQIKREEIVGRTGVVAAGHEEEAAAGVQMLEQGGNAADAAVAAAFVAAVVEPWNCGLGGHGFAAIASPKSSEITVVDWLNTVPRAARSEMWELEDGYGGVFGWRRVKDNGQEIGYLATALPGTVGGLCRIHELFGRLPLARVLEPAIARAEDGMPVNWRLVLMAAAEIDTLRQFPATAEIFLKNGQLPRAGNFYTPGDRLVQKDLGRTLRAIAQGGARAFYEGEFAHLTAAHMAAVGGLITVQDLREYQPVVFAEPMHTYRGYEYATCDSPIIVEALNILENFDLASLGPDSADYRHLVIEALWRAFEDNLAYNGDPNFTDVPKRALASKEYARARAREIDLRRASREVLTTDPWAYEGRPRPNQALGTVRAGAVGHTTEVAAADSEGTMVSMLTSLGTLFGSRVTIPGTGVVLSNHLQSFDPEPDKPNSIAPGKRALLIAPAVIMRREGRPYAGICGSGGRRITGGVLHTMLNLVDFGLSIQPAIEARRLHTETGEVYIDSEIPRAVQADLAERGHRLVPVHEGIGSANFGSIVGVTAEANGELHAGADPIHSAATAGL